MKLLLQIEKVVQSSVGEHATHEHLAVGRADPVDATVALHQPHRVPRQVVVDDVAGLLQVHPFGQHVGGHHDVVQIVVRALGGISGAGGEPPHHRLLAGRLIRSGERGDPPPIRGQPAVGLDRLGQMPAYPLHRVGEVAEDQHLAPVAHVLGADPGGGRLLGDVAKLSGQLGQSGVLGPGHGPGGGRERN